MLENLYEDTQFKVLYGVSLKGTHAISRAPRILIINKLIGKEISQAELPVEILTQVLKITE